MGQTSRFSKAGVINFWIFLVSIVLSEVAASSSLRLDPAEHHYTLSREVAVLADSSGSLTFTAVNAPKYDSRWENLNQTIFNKGFTSVVYWFRFSLANPEVSAREMLLEVGYPLLDSVDLYFVGRSSKKKFFKHYHIGDKLPFSERLIEHPSFVFPLTIAGHSNADVYLRVQTTSSMQVPLSLWSPTAFLKKSQAEILLKGILVGLMAVMSVYNLFLYFAIRDKSYLYFVLCIANYALGQAITMGIAFPYLWPDNPWWNDKSLVVANNLGLIGMALFSKHFLKLPDRSPKVARLFSCYAFLCMALAVGSLVLPYSVAIQMTVVGVVLIPLSAYLMGIKLWINGIRCARYFCIAFTCFVVGAIIFLLNKYGLLPRTVVTEYAIYVGSSLVVCLFSFALADRINTERIDKELAQHQAIANLREYRKLYENALEGIFRISLDGKPLAVNPSFLTLIGATSMDDFFAKVRNLGEYIAGSKMEYQRILAILEKRQKVVRYEMKSKKLDGTSIWCEVSAMVVDPTEGVAGYIDGSIIDTTERKKNELQLNYLASHDPLTDLINRREFERRVQNALNHCDKHQSAHALLFLDLDQFKIVNDTCGHEAGDELLRQIAMIFYRHVRQRDSLARLGGDEFAILLEQCDLEKANEIARCLRSDVNDFRFVWGQQSFSLGVSIGLVPMLTGSESVTQLFSLADTACYEAKDSGRNRIFVYNAEDGNLKRRQNEMQLVSTVSDAIERNDLVLYRQAVRSINPGQPIDERYEILVRMRVKGELLPPGAFLPAAERYNTITVLDRSVIQSFLAWLSQYPEHANQLQMASINLSGQSLGDADLLLFIQSAFKYYSVDPAKICFEITESAAISNLGDTLHFMDALSRSGVKFALDDFGSGFSSYGYLKTLPVDYIKIDGSFVRNIVTDPIDYVMVKSIADIADAMKIDSIAEFVEDESIYDKLKPLGIKYIQGYYVGKPEPLPDFTMATDQYTAVGL